MMTGSGWGSISPKLLAGEGRPLCFSGSTHRGGKGAHISRLGAGLRQVHPRRLGSYLSRSLRMLRNIQLLVGLQGHLQSIYFPSLNSSTLHPSTSLGQQVAGLASGMRFFSPGQLVDDMAGAVAHQAVIHTALHNLLVSSESEDAHPPGSTERLPKGWYSCGPAPAAGQPPAGQRPEAVIQLWSVRIEAICFSSLQQDHRHSFMDVKLSLKV